MSTLRTLVLATLFVGIAATRAEVVVVVAAQSPITALDNSQIADVFLGKLTRLPGGVTVVPLDQAEGSRARDEFYLKMTGKSAAQLKAFWSKLIFTGRGRPPKVLPSNALLLKSVRENPAAIGYIERSETDQSVRILR